MDIFQNIECVPFESEQYPKEWKSLSDAPKIIYAVGDLALLNERKMVMVGSRRTPAAILKHAQSVAQQLSSVFCLITGVADVTRSVVVLNSFALFIDFPFFQCFPGFIFPVNVHKIIKTQADKNFMVVLFVEYCRNVPGSF